MSDVAEQLNSIFGFVVYHQGGEVRIPEDLLHNPPENKSIEVFFDNETSELVVRLVDVE